MKPTSYDALTKRDYEKEQRKSKKLEYQGFVDTLVQKPLSVPAFATAAGYAGREYFKNNKKLNDVFSVDKVFDTLRILESRLPIFNIPLRTTQIADMLSPFVSEKSLKWQYGGKSLLDQKGTGLKKEFQFLEELAGRPLATELSNPGAQVRFEKTGKVFGNIVLEEGGKKKNLAEDVFMMQRPSSRTGALSSIFDAGKRPTNFYKALDKEWQQRFEGLGFSPEWAEKLRFGGGVAKTLVGESVYEFVKGANKFLKEPIPGLNFLLDWEIEKKTFASKIYDLGEMGKPLGQLFKDKMAMTVSEKDPLGRLPRFLRPYVTSEAWQKSSLKMLTALSAKGALLTGVLPSLYGGLDYAREKMEPLPMVAKVPIMAMVGAGVGGLLKSKDVDFGIFRGSKLMTKTQLGGAVVGAVAGLPIFDRGLTAGFGSLYGSANILGARAWNLVGGQDALRRQEELFPGMTNPMTGVGFAMGGGFIGYFNSELGLMRSPFLQKELEIGGMKGKELTDHMFKVATGKEKGQHLGSFITEAFTKETGGRVRSVAEASRVLRGTGEGAPKTVLGAVAEVYKRLGEEKLLDSSISISHSTVEGAEESAQRLFTHIREITDTSRKQDLRLKNETSGFFGRVRNRIEHHLSDRPGFWRGFAKGALAFGAVAQVGAVVAGVGGGNLNPVNLLPGWLINLTGGGKSAKETEDIFTGKQEIAVRKGRAWALGSSPFEGSKVDYFRQHRAVLMQSDAEDVALYGSKDEKIAYDPILHPIRALFDNEFKYHRDTRLSEISPTPLTSRMFADVPIFGDILASTVGQVIKPSRAIRPGEWKTPRTNEWSARSFQEQAVQATPGSDQWHEMRTAPAVPEIGGESQHYARNPMSAYQVGRNTLKRLNEQVGLRGFLFSNALTGSVGYEESSYDPVIESGDRTFSARTKFWSLNLGDPFGTCFVGDTLVNTIEGKKPIRDIEKGELVLSLDGQYRQVVETVCHEKHDKRLLRFTFGEFEGQFTCTDNHWIPTIKHSITRDKQAKDFVVGDYLICPIPQENLGYQSVIKPKSAYFFGLLTGKTKSAKRIPPEIFFGGKDIIEQYILGVFKGGRRKTIFPSRHKEFITDLWKVMLLMGIKGSVSKDSEGWKWTVDEESKRVLVDLLIKLECPPIQLLSYVLVPITSIEVVESEEPVYDLEIENLHYYVVEDVAVHNTEGLRRYLTKDRNVYYNPLSNMAPSWLPRDNYFMDFSKGNYFNSVQEGAIRLPGAGLERLNPELEGLHPENYSLGWKYKILSSVAYGSQEWALTKDRVKGALSLGQLSERDQELVSQSNQQLEERKLKKTFRKYQFDKEDELTSRELTISGIFDDGTFTAVETGSQQLSLGGANISMAALSRQQLERGNAKTIADANRLAEEAKHNIVQEMRSHLRIGKRVQVSMRSGNEAFENQKTDVFIEGLTSKVEGWGGERKDEPLRAGQQFNAFQKVFGRAWELYTHNADLPVTPAMLYNKISPFQPHSKFIKRLSPVELYAQQRVYGRELQMWQNYKEDFIDPVLHDVTSRIGGDYIPTRVAYERTMVEYFDKLKWLKNYMLEQSAVQTGRDELAEFFREKKKKTIYGADPYRGMSDIWRALPGTERDFYQDFANETSEKERARILDLAPEMMKRIYIANWQNKDMRGLARKAEAGVATQEEKGLLRNLYKLRETEGFSETSKLKQQYENETRGTEISYADWARIKELKEYFKAFKLPEKDFIGFDPRTDLEDIKLKVAKNEGLDFHNIGLWDQQAASLRGKPYVGAGASAIANWQEGDPRNEDFEGRIRRTIGTLNSVISLTPLPGASSKVIMQASDTRHNEIKHYLTKGAF